MERRLRQTGRACVRFDHQTSNKVKNRVLIRFYLSVGKRCTGRSLVRTVTILVQQSSLLAVSSTFAISNRAPNQMIILIKVLTNSFSHYTTFSCLLWPVSVLGLWVWDYFEYSCTGLRFVHFCQPSVALCTNPTQYILVLVPILSNQSSNRTRLLKNTKINTSQESQKLALNLLSCGRFPSYRQCMTRTWWTSVFKFSSVHVPIDLGFLALVITETIKKWVKQTKI